jgi:hypothetical protein
MNRDTMTWEEAYELLADAERSSESEAICAAITRLGKPYDEQQVRRAAPLVLKYLNHENHVVRYQAIWFLGGWSKLHEYLPSIIQSAQSDADFDNRAFAARCAGQVLKSHRDTKATNVLLHMAMAEEEEPDVRLSAYSALIYAFYGEAGRNQAREFEPVGNKSVGDFDLAWLASLPQWIEGNPIG